MAMAVVCSKRQSISHPALGLWRCEVIALHCRGLRTARGRYNRATSTTRHRLASVMSRSLGELATLAEEEPQEVPVGQGLPQHVLHSLDSIAERRRKSGSISSEARSGSSHHLGACSTNRSTTETCTNALLTGAVGLAHGVRYRWAEPHIACCPASGGLLCGAPPSMSDC